MTTTTIETAGESKLPLAPSPGLTPTTVATSSHEAHESVLVTLATPSKYTQLIAEHAEMIQAGKTSHEIIMYL
jgi:hypothetical protein